MKLLVLLSAIVLAQGSFAQSGAPGVSFEWVTIGNPGNPNDPLIDVPPLGGGPRPERGAVPYVYSISKYETTIGQYTAFLNAVAKSDPHGLYHPGMGSENPSPALLSYSRTDKVCWSAFALPPLQTLLQGV